MIMKISFNIKENSLGIYFKNDLHKRSLHILFFTLHFSLTLHKILIDFSIIYYIFL